MSNVSNKKDFEEKLLRQEADKIISALRIGVSPLKVTIMFNEIHQRLLRAGIITR